MVIICTTYFKSKELWILPTQCVCVCVCVFCMILFVNRVNLLVFILGMQHVCLCVETEFLSRTCLNQVFERLYAVM